MTDYHFMISPESIEATLEWLDKGSPGGGSGIGGCGMRGFWIG